MKKIIGLLIILFIFITPYIVKAEDIYDVILFWGQSNMVGFAGAYPSKGGKIGEDKKDVRLTELGVDEFSKRSKIDKEIVNKYVTMAHLDIPFKSKTVYEYSYLNNNLVELTSSTRKLGEILSYSPSSNKNEKCSSKCSIQSSAGTSLAMYYAKTHYEKTGHKVIIVHAALGGQEIARFLPHDRAIVEAKSTDAYNNKYIYEAIREKYKSAIKYLNDNNMKIGNMFHVSMQGESDTAVARKRLMAVDSNFSYKTSNKDANYQKIYREEVDRYYKLYLEVHNNLKKDLGLKFGTLVETSAEIGSSWIFGVLTVHEAQEKLIKNNKDIIKGSTYAYDRYIPREVDYTGSDDFQTLRDNNRLGVCISEASGGVNVIHFNAAGISQIGKETATKVSSYLKSIEVKKTTVTIPSSNSMIYNGSNQNHGINIPNGAIVIENESVLMARNVGKYNITIKLQDTNNYVWSDGTNGNKTITWEIKPFNISDANVSDIATQKYTGKEIKPTIKVMSGIRTLTENVDYTVSYKNNIQSGEASIIITGIKNNTGEKIVTFNILEEEKIQELFLDSLSVSDVSLTPKFSKKVVKYTGVTNKEKVTITAKGNGSISGTGEKKLKVGNNDFKITISDNNGNKKDYTISIVRSEGNKKPVVAKIENLSIEGCAIEFKKDTYEYEIVITTNIDKLNFKDITLDNPDASYEIINNEILDTENVVTILVTSKDNVTVEYNIKVIKLVDYLKNEDIYLYLFGGFFIIILLLLILLIFKKRKV